MFKLLCIHPNFEALSAGTPHRAGPGPRRPRSSAAIPVRPLATPVATPRLETLESRNPKCVRGSRETGRGRFPVPSCGFSLDQFDILQHLHLQSDLFWGRDPQRDPRAARFAATNILCAHSFSSVRPQSRRFCPPCSDSRHYQPNFLLLFAFLSPRHECKS